MPVTPFSETYSQGTHFSDGVRVGPIYGTAYSTGPVGGNFSTPLPTETPADQLKQNGVLLGPIHSYFLTPYTSSPACFYAGAQTTSGASFLTLTAPAFTNTGATIVPLQSSVTVNVTGTSTQQNFNSAYVLDCPRCISLTYGINVDGTSLTFSMFGYDRYGFPLVSTVSGSKGTTSASTMQVFPKAVKVLLGVYVSGNLPTNITIGTADVFGLPYCVDNQSCLQAYWAGLPTSSPTTNSGPIAGITGGDGSNLIFSSTKNFLPASPAPYAYSSGSGSFAATTSIVATARSGDVRGLFAVPTASNFAYNMAGGQSQANQLLINMFLPGAMATKPGLYTPNSTFPMNNPIGVTPSAGELVLVPSTNGGLNYLPQQVPTLPSDLYGYPQYSGIVGQPVFTI